MPQRPKCFILLDRQSSIYKKLLNNLDRYVDLCCKTDDICDEVENILVFLLFKFSAVSTGSLEQPKVGLICWFYLKSIKFFLGNYCFNLFRQTTLLSNWNSEYHCLCNYRVSWSKTWFVLCINAICWMFWGGVFFYYIC